MAQEITGEVNSIYTPRLLSKISNNHSLPNLRYNVCENENMAFWNH